VAWEEPELVEPPAPDAPPADAPPVDSLEAPPVDSLARSLDFASSPSPSRLDELPSLLLEVVAEVAGVVVVEVVSVASFSAAVSFGGVMSGVLLGVTSETLVPPQALSVSAHSASAAHAASAVRGRR
jgi:hypothetical protein